MACQILSILSFQARSRAVLSELLMCSWGNELWLEYDLQTRISLPTWEPSRVQSLLLPSGLAISSTWDNGCSFSLGLWDAGGQVTCAPVTMWDRQAVSESLKEGGIWVKVWRRRVCEPRDLWGKVRWKGHVNTATGREGLREGGVWWRRVPFPRCPLVLKVGLWVRKLGTCRNSWVQSCFLHFGHSGRCGQSPPSFLPLWLRRAVAAHGGECPGGSATGEAPVLRRGRRWAEVWEAAEQSGCSWPEQRGVSQENSNVLEPQVPMAGCKPQHRPPKETQTWLASGFLLQVAPGSTTLWAK